jgi:pyruvate dehydrogenase E1 component alpha subunit
VADRARACGIWERKVDGADPIAVWAAIAVAAARARERKGPSLVEIAVTQLVHEPPAHRDPVERLRRHLDAAGQWSTTFQEVIEADIRGHLDRAFASSHADGSAGGAA